MSIRRMNLARKLVVVLITVALLTAFVPAIGTAKAQGTAACPILITMFDTLYVRSGPSWTSPIVNTLVAGNLICLTGRNNEVTWLQLSQQNGAVIGWAPANAFWTTRPVSTLPVVGATPPPPTVPPPAPPTGTTYVVQAGDTVFSIAQRFGITIQALVAANNIGADYRIYIGQVLVIPGATQPPPGNFINYTVQRGDYLVRIGLQYGVDWRVIAQVNNIQPPYIIYAGNVLRIPVAG